MNVDWVTVYDQEIIDLILLIKRTNDDEFELIDKLKEVMGKRKIKIKYYTPTQAKYIYLTPNTLKSLRSYLLNKGEGSDTYTAEYIEDVFVDDVYELELLELKSVKK